MFALPAPWASNPAFQESPQAVNVPAALSYLPKGIDENLACPALGCVSLFLNKDQLAGALSQERLRCSVVCWQDLKMGNSGAPGGHTSCGVDEAQTVKTIHSLQVELSGSGSQAVGQQSSGSGRGTPEGPMKFYRAVSKGNTSVYTHFI